jgi:hypothetical protein
LGEGRGVCCSEIRHTWWNIVIRTPIVYRKNLYVFSCQMWQGLIIMPCLSPCWTWRRRSRTTWGSWGGGSPCRPSRARSSRTALSRRDWRSPWLSRASSLVKVAFSVRNTKHLEIFVFLIFVTFFLDCTALQWKFKNGRGQTRRKYFFKTNFVGIFFLVVSVQVEKSCKVGNLLILQLSQFASKYVFAFFDDVLIITFKTSLLKSSCSKL